MSAKKATPKKQKPTRAALEKHTDLFAEVIMSDRKATPKKPKSKGLLYLRLSMWSHDQDRLTYLNSPKKGTSPTSLQEAREYARSHGYQGIQVKPD